MSKALVHEKPTTAALAVTLAAHPGGGDLRIFLQSRMCVRLGRMTHIISLGEIARAAQLHGIPGAPMNNQWAVRD
jgi:hypothetical protein